MKIKRLSVLFVLLFVFLLLPLFSCNKNGSHNISKTDYIDNPITSDETTTQGNIDLPTPPKIPEGIDPEEISLTYAAISLDLMSYGYNVFNAKAQNSIGSEYGLGYCDYQEGYEFDNEDKTYLLSGFISFSPNGGTIFDDDNLLDLTYLVPIDEQANEIENEEYCYIVDYAEKGLPSGHFIINDRYVKYEVVDGNVEIESFENVKSNYDLTLGSIYNYDIEDYIFIPYDEISSDPIEYVPLVSEINKEELKTELENVLDKQESDGYFLEDVTIGYISLDALNSLRGILTQEDRINGYSYEELNSVEYDSSKQYMCFEEDGSIEFKDLPPFPKTERKNLIDWIVDGLILAGTAAVAVVCAVYMGPAGGVIAAGLIGAGIQYFQETVIGQKKFSEVNWAKVGIMGVSGAISAVIPCSGVLGYVAAGIVGGATSAAIAAVDGAPLEDILLEGAKGALTSVILHGLFASCFPRNTKILTDKGLLPIELITVGTLVASYNIYTKEIEYKPVKDVYKNYATCFTNVLLSDGETITSTSNHPYYIPELNTYISANELEKGMKVLNNEGKLLEIIDINSFYQEQEVYNLNVEDNHNYFVGEDEILVHNKCSSSARSKAGKTARAEALDDIMSGEEKLIKKWGLDPLRYESDAEIVKFVQKNGCWPVLKTDGFQCEFAHAVDVSILNNAFNNGLISESQYKEFLTNPMNGILTSRSTHLKVLHGGNFKNHTNVDMVCYLREGISDYVKKILKAIGEL